MEQKLGGDELELTDQVIYINRITKVVKGGKNLRFSALVVVGDGKGQVGFAMSKAREVPQAIKKSVELAKKRLIKIPIIDGTIPHTIVGHFGASKVVLKPASKGTGVIAGGPVRAVMQLSGIQNILTKSLGSSNPSNVVKATFEGLKNLKNPEQVFKLRGIKKNSQVK